MTTTISQPQHRMRSAEIKELWSYTMLLFSAIGSVGFILSGFSVDVVFYLAAICLIGAGILHWETYLRYSYRKNDSTIENDRVPANATEPSIKHTLPYNSDESALREQLLASLVDRAAILGELGRLQEALSLYDQVFAQSWRMANLRSQEQVARASVDKGIILAQLGRIEEAITEFEDVVERHSGIESSGIREQIGRALSNKSFWLMHVNRTGGSPARSELAQPIVDAPAC